MGTGLQEAEQRSARAANVQETGRAGSKSGFQRNGRPKKAASGRGGILSEARHQERVNRAPLDLVNNCLA
jgi:hypothetical protein